MSDLAFLIHRQTIDWHLFWELARKGRQTRGCLLALKLTQRYWGVNGIAWPEVGQPDLTLMGDSVDAASLLMLRDFSARNDMGLNGEIRRAKGLAAKAGVVLDKVFPSKAKISANYPVAQGDWRVYLWYPVKWHHQLTRRLLGFLKFRQQPHLHPEVRQVARLEKWLAG